MLGSEVLLTIIAAFGAGIISAAEYVRWAEHWLANKEKQVKDLNDRLFHSFIDVMRDACKCFSEYDKKEEDDPVTQSEFEELVGWAKPIDTAVNPVLKYDMVLNRLKITLRRGAASWVVVPSAATAAAIIWSNAEGFVGLEAAAIIGFSLVAIVALGFALFAFMYGIHVSNNIDKESTGAGSLRTWRVRSK